MSLLYHGCCNILYMYIYVLYVLHVIGVNLSKFMVNFNMHICIK